ncbi:MAG: SH3 domain-containing protein [Hyphomicrobiales bacterium]
MKKTIQLLFMIIFSGFAHAAELDIPVIEHKFERLDTCILGRVLRLDPNGDGFLAVRSGPDSKYKKLDELHNGDDIWVFDQKGKWLGILYGIENPNCRAIEADRPVPYKGKQGWVHQNWVDIIAS